MAFGIDFGTTNSVIARYDNSSLEVLSIDEPPGDWAQLGFDRVLPTVFAIGDSDEPLFGWAAKQRPGSLAAVKRLLREEESVEIDGETYPVEEVATMLFAHLRGSVSSQGLTMDRAVVTVPANSRGLARYRTKITAGMAGVQVQALINEPTAAAMAYSLQATHEETLLVVDWGGGTLDVTILRSVAGVFMEQASKGIQKLGGLDLDAAFAKSIKSTIDDLDTWTPAERQAFRLDVERAKILLSTQESTSLPLPRGEYRKVTRDMFRDAVRPQIERLRDPIARCLADVGAQPSDIDALVLVGGTCKVPAVRDFVSDLLEASPAQGVDPMTAVAEGAAVAAAILSGELDDNDFFVSTEHALGTVVVDPAGSGLSFSELIPRNHKLPARATDVYTPVVDFQENLQITVVEGDPDLPLDHPDNVVLKEWQLVLKPAPVAESSFELTYSYDTDGILHVSAVDAQGNTMLDDSVSYAGMLDQRGLVQASKRANAALDSGSVDRSSRDRTDLPAEIRSLLHDARAKVIPFIDDDEAAEMRICAERVEAGDAGAVNELRGHLDRYPYLL